MREDRLSRAERGQAYTLEGFVGAMVVLMAVLFAIQAVVITPTTGGAVDRTAQAQLQQELQDSLLVAENEGNLSYLVRHWEVDESEDEVTFDGSDPALDDRRGHYNTSAFEKKFAIGEMLDERFANRSGQNYNVVLTYQNGSRADREALVYQGKPDTNAFAASHQVTLYDDQELTSDSESRSLKDVYDDPDLEPPIPRYSDKSSEVYNVVEVRVIVW